MAVYLIPVEKGRPIILDKAVVFIGRHPECDVILKSSRKVSRKHCCLAQVESRIVIRDLGSMNGIRLNGRRVKKEATVKLGDEITIGDVNYILKSRGRMDSESDSASQWGSGSQSTGEGAHSSADRSAPSGRAPSSQSGSSQRRGNLPPLGISQDFPVPIPEDPAEQFERDDSRHNSSSNRPLSEDED
ncbi:MAG: FHA domain-containing protein [Planctomycetaceae bacterium]|nr:FHA domain-containing protein [Planctomycetaceae bacterium]